MFGLLFALAVAAAAPSECSYDREVTLSLGFKQFDQDLAGGWRPLADKPDCRMAAADLLAAYRTVHWNRRVSVYKSYRFRIGGAKSPLISVLHGRRTWTSSTAFLNALIVPMRRLMSAAHERGRSRSRAFRS